MQIEHVALWGLPRQRRADQAVRSCALAAISLHFWHGRSGAASSNRFCIRTRRPSSPCPSRKPWRARQSDHVRVGPQHIAEQQFDAVGRRFAFDFLEQGRAEAKMAPVICN